MQPRSRPHAANRAATARVTAIAIVRVLVAATASVIVAAARMDAIAPIATAIATAAIVKAETAGAIVIANTAATAMRCAMLRANRSETRHLAIRVRRVSRIRHANRVRRVTRSAMPNAKPSVRLSVSAIANVNASNRPPPPLPQLR